MFEILPTDSPYFSTSVVFGLVAIVVYQLYSWYVRYRNWVSMYDILPMKKPRHWFWGHMNEHPGPSGEGIRFQVSFTKLFPRFHAIWFGRLRCVIIAHHPDIVKDVLRASANAAIKPSDSGTIYHLGIRWLGEGLLIANGNKWARNRRLLTPAFHFDMLKSYLAVQNSCTDILLGKMTQFADDGESFEVFEHIGLCSLDIISRCSFSYETNCQTQGENSPYVKAVHGLSELWVKRSLNVIHSFDFIYFNLTRDGKEFARLCDFVHGVSEDIIDKRRHALKHMSTEAQDIDAPGKHCKDFLDIMLTAKDEDGKSLSHLEIRNEVDTFLFEGHDTTTSGMSYALYLLAKHVDIQEKCRQEIDNIFKDRDTDTIEYKDLSEMEYLTQCIKESLRYASPVFFIMRQMTEDFKFDGHHIPAGTNVAIDIHNLHHNASVWGEDYDEFKPERFDPDNARKMDPFAFLPFSAGPRNCIGQNFAMNEMKIVIARLLYRFVFTVRPGQIIEKRLGVIMKTKDGIFLNVERRKFRQ